MAFKPAKMAYHSPERGTGGLMVYIDSAESLGDIKASGYFNHNDVRSFIQKQRDGTAAANGVPVLMIGSGTTGMELDVARVDGNGNVTLAGGNSNVS